MLTNLNWLKSGERFPPKEEVERIGLYTHNRNLFESRHSEEYEVTLRRIQRIIGNFEEVVSYPIVINYQKLMSLKIADLLFGEPPVFTTGNQEELDKIIKESDLLNLLYMVAIDVSRYGDGLFLIIPGKGVEIASPSVWYPIVSPENVKEITAHVLGWIAEDQLHIQIHTKGICEYRTYGYDRGSIGALLKTSSIATGLSDFAVIQVSNTITSDRTTGMDDYTDIDSIISELMVRIGQISRILDKHANPSMQGPASALERDPVSGQYRLKVGSYFSIESKEDAGVSYITWDGQLDSNFKQIERLINLLYTISEMGSSVFGDMSQSAGQAPSGTALKRLMISALAKVNRIRMRFDSGLKNMFGLWGETMGLDLSDVSISWQDGLPADPKEEADIIKTRREATTMSQKRALMQYDKMSEEDADEEILTISEENAANNPMVDAANMTANTGDGEEDGEEIINS